MSWGCVQISWHVVVPWKSEILKQRDPKTWEMACQGANRGDRTTHLRSNVGTRASVTLSWEQGSWDKTFSSSPIHSPCVGLCDPSAPCTQASPRGKHNVKDWRSVTLPVSSWGAGLGLPVKLGREGKGRDCCRAAHGWFHEVWSSAGPQGVPCMPAVCRKDPGSSFFIPARALFHFLPLW